MRRLFLLGVGLVLVGCGSGGAGSGACEQVGTGGERFCHNFRDTQYEQGKDICDRLQGTWSAGTTCGALGYTKECTDGSFVKPAGVCAG